MRWTVEELHKLRQGLRHFRTGAYFEAHDDWEEVWQDLRGRQRLFWQAMIQLAVGMVHWQSGNLKGCKSVWRKALQKCDDVACLYDGEVPVPLLHLIAVLAEGLETAEQGHDPTPIMAHFATAVLSEAWFAVE